VTRQNPEEEVDISAAGEEEESGLAWCVEVEPPNGAPSIFYSARKVVLSSDFVEIQLLDGKYVAHPVEQVRKVLSMRPKASPGYTGEAPIPDEIY
jgi:hypothetical protein